jgi:hypothetical protein
VDTLYLDTNHVSHLARHPDAADSRAVLAVLSAGRYKLGLSIFHLQELSAPTFSSRSQVGALLDRLPIAWAPTPDVLFKLEARWAVERALSDVVVDHHVFTTSFERALGAPPEANILISEMLEAFAEHAHLRDHLHEAAREGATADAAWKRNAAVVRAPDEPVLSLIHDALTNRPPSGIVLQRPYPAADVLRRIGGVAALPAYQVSLGLARTRLNDESFEMESNDVVDEWHACYAPYCAAMALDTRTTARLRSARLPCVSRVTHRLADIPAILRENHLQ